MNLLPSRTGLPRGWRDAPSVRKAGEVRPPQRMYDDRLLLSAHALFGNKQDHGAAQQDGTHYVEDGGTHAAGGGKLGAGLVDDVDTAVSSFPISTGICQGGGNIGVFDPYFHTAIQLVVAVGLLGFLQPVGGVGVQTDNGGLTTLCNDGGRFESIICAFLYGSNTVVVPILYQRNQVSIRLSIIEGKLRAVQQLV